MKIFTSLYTLLDPLENWIHLQSSHYLYSLKKLFDLNTSNQVYPLNVYNQQFPTLSATETADILLG